MSWTRTFGKSLAIVAYFFAATVWLPDRITKLSAGSVLRDMLVVLVWAVGLALGMWMLHTAQRRGVI
jgi:hypothetical protein